MLLSHARTSRPRAFCEAALARRLELEKRRLNKLDEDFFLFLGGGVVVYSILKEQSMFV